jgi:hypothetical protein
MPKSRTILSILAASPDDVMPEREILEEVVRELNVTWSTTLGVGLDLISWTTHSYPGFGADAQDVINQQIGSGYDIFIGIMWTKFGTPTTRAGSGTAEEFTRAFDRYRADPGSLKIMFYFKDEPVSPSLLNLEQYQKVRLFRDRLGREGGLYWTFRSDFESFIRLHLAREIQEWLKRPEVRNANVTASVAHDSSGTTAVVVPAPESDDELGIFDHMEAFFVHFARVKESQSRLTQAMEELGIRVDERTEEQKRINAVHHGDVSLMKRTANRIAEDMTQFVARVDVDSPIFGGELQDSMRSFSMAITLAADFGPDTLGDTTELRGNVTKMANSLQSTTASIAAFRQMIASVPRLTSEFNRARKKTVDVLDRLVEQMRTGHALMLQVIRAIDSFGTIPPAETE